MCSTTLVLSAPTHADYKLTLCGASPGGLRPLIGVGTDATPKASHTGSTVAYHSSDHCHFLEIGRHPFRLSDVGRGHHKGKTITAMKRLGYSSAFAGAAEVAASTGGFLLSPAMGATAFIMAEYTGIPCVEISLTDLMPALLSHVPIHLQVHLRAKRSSLAPLGEAGIPP